MYWVQRRRVVHGLVTGMPSKLTRADLPGRRDLPVVVMWHVFGVRQVTPGQEPVDGKGIRGELVHSVGLDGVGGGGRGRRVGHKESVVQVQR